MKAPKRKSAAKSKGRSKRVKDLQPRDARAVRGGGVDIFAKIGEIKGSSDSPPDKARFR